MPRRGLSARLKGFDAVADERAAALAVPLLPFEFEETILVVSEIAHRRAHARYGGRAIRRDVQENGGTPPFLDGRLNPTHEPTHEIAHCIGGYTAHSCIQSRLSDGLL